MKKQKNLSIFLSLIFLFQILTSTTVVSAESKNKSDIELSKNLQTVTDSVYSIDNDSGITKENEKNDKEIIVKYRKQSEADKVKEDIVKRKVASKVKVKKANKNHRMETLELGKSDNVEKVIQELNSNPAVEYAQPNYDIELFDTIQDVRFSEQWNLLNNGQPVNGEYGIYGKDINVLPAWDITEGNSTIVVGVLDTGIDISVNDLKDNIFINTGEIPGNGLDDDNNGYVDDVYGWDFVNKDNSIFDADNLDAHGSHVAGIIASSANEYGIRGVAPKVRVLPLKFISGNTGKTSDAIEAIDYAVKMGVKIINCSWGGSDYNPALKDVMENSNAIFICAAGNSGKNLDSSPVYPACFNLSNTITVGAVDNKGEVASFSNYGSKVHVAAPGVGILSTLPGEKHGLLSGTSMAAPHVAGAAALINSCDTSLNIYDIKARLLRNVTKSMNLSDKIATSGRLNVYCALIDQVPPEENDQSIEDDLINIEEPGVYDTSLEGNNKVRKPLLAKRNSLADAIINSGTANISSSGNGIENLSVIICKENSLTVIWSTVENSTTEFYYGTEQLENSHISNTYTKNHQITVEIGDISNIKFYKVRSISKDGTVFESEVRPLKDDITDLSSKSTSVIDESVKAESSLNLSDVSTSAYVEDSGTNHSFDTAQQITEGTVFGTMGPETDYYAINFELGKTYSIDLIGMADGEDYDLYLDNNSIQRVDFSNNWFNYDENITYTATYTGTYYIRILPYTLSSSSLHHNYQLLVYCTDNPPDAYEPNDGANVATPISLNTTIEATINVNTDEDWFVFDAPKAGKIHVNLKSIPLDCDYDIEVFDGNETYLGGSYVRDYHDDSFIYLVPSPGKYYIRVCPYGGSSNAVDSYEISVNGVYTPDSYELNDNIYTVYYYSKPTINLESEISATIDNINDVDGYRFDLTQDTKVGIRLQNMPYLRNYNVVLYSFRYSYGVTEIARSANDEDMDEEIICDLMPGSYIIKVYSSSGCNEWNNYKLSLRDENRGRVSIDIDNNVTLKDHIMTATVKVDKIANLAGYQVNLKYDPEVLMPLKDDLTPYTESTVPSGRDVLINSSYSPTEIATNDLEKGILNFSASYNYIDDYKLSGVPESSGSIAVIKFKVLKSNQISLKFAPTDIMKDCLDGIYLFDWDGNLNNYYTAKNSRITNIIFPSNEQDITISADDVNAFVTEEQYVTYNSEAMYYVDGYVKPDFSYKTNNGAALVLSGFKVTIKGQYKDESGIHDVDPENKLTANTDQYGYFRIDGIRDGNNYTIEISKDSFLTRTDTIDVLSNLSYCSGDGSPVLMWAGDVFEDNAINMIDIMEIIKSFNTIPTDEEYNIKSDLNLNNAINMEDIMILVTHFNTAPKNYPPQYCKKVDKFIIENKKLYEDEIIYGDLEIKNGLLDLNGHTLRVKGDLLQTSGTEDTHFSEIRITGGQLIVEKNYKLEGHSRLVMMNPKDRVTVNGNFITVSTIDHMINNSKRSNDPPYGENSPCLTDGILEVKGNFLQGTEVADEQGVYKPYTNPQNQNPNPNNFYTTGNHKVVLSGTNPQTVVFISNVYESNSSNFNILEIRNSSLEGVKFGYIIENNAKVISKLNANSINYCTKMTGEVRINKLIEPLQCDLLIEGKLIIDFPHSDDNPQKPCRIDMNGHKITVSGDLEQRDGTIDVNGGTLDVKGSVTQVGDYTLPTIYVNNGYVEVGGNFTSGTGKTQSKLIMTKPTDYVLVRGNFTAYSFLGASDLLTAGTLEIKGHFSQLWGGTYGGSAKNFYATDDHKVILSGTAEQIISFEKLVTRNNDDGSKFNILIISNKLCKFLQPEAKIHSKYIVSESNTDTKTITENMKTGRKGHSAVSIGGKIYTLGGIDGSENYLSSVEKFSLYGSQGAGWTDCFAMNQPRSDFDAVAINNVIYIIGGKNANGYVSNIEKYDTSNIDANLSNVEFSHSGLRREGHSAVSLDGYIYIIGGKDGDTYKNDIWRYNPNETDQSKALIKMDYNLLQGRAHFGAVVKNDLIYVFGGSNGVSDLNTVEVIDPNSPSVNYGTQMPEERSIFKSVAVNGKIYLLGGIGGDDSVNTIRECEPNGTTIIYKENPQNQKLDNAVMYFATASIYNRIYIIGGIRSTVYTKAVDIVEEYIPAELPGIKFPDKYLGKDTVAARKMYLDNHVNIVTGNYMDQVVDIRINSTGIDFVLERTYNSAAREDSSHLGKGWRLNYDTYVEPLETGIYKVIASSLNVRNAPWGTIKGGLLEGTLVSIVDGTEITEGGIIWVQLKTNNGEVLWVAKKYLQQVHTGVKVTYPSGSKVVFYKNSNGEYFSYGNYDQLIEATEGTSTIYKLLRKDDNMLYVYNKQSQDNKMRLGGIADINGNQLTIDYDSSGRITYIKDAISNQTTNLTGNAFARKLVFDYADNTYDLAKHPELVGSNSNTNLVKTIGVEYKVYDKNTSSYITKTEYIVFGYDSNDQLVTVYGLDDTKTEYEYDPSRTGLLESVSVNGIKQLHNVYEEITDRIISKTDAVGNTEIYQYYDGLEDNDKDNISDSNELIRYYFDKRGNKHTTVFSLVEMKPIFVEGPKDDIYTNIQPAEYKYFIKNGTEWMEITNLKESDVNYGTYRDIISNGNCDTKELITNPYGNITEVIKDKYGNTMETTSHAKNDTNKYIKNKYDYKELSFNQGSFNGFTVGNLEREALYDGAESGKCIDTVQYVYDAYGRLEKVVKPLSIKDINESTINNVKYTGDNGEKFSITTYIYDDNYTIKGLVKDITYPEGGKKTYTYYNDGYGVNTLTEVNISTDVDKVITYSKYDWAGRYQEEKTSNCTNTYEYDKKGNVTKVTKQSHEVLEECSVTRFMYDEFGRKEQELTPKLYDKYGEGNKDVGYRYTYYRDGKLFTVTDPENNVTKYKYDEAGNLETETKPNGAVYSYNYDWMNRLIDVKYSGVVLEKYVYDVLPDGKTTKTHNLYFDQADENNVATTVSTYDFAGRLVEQSLPDGGSVSKEYYADGRVKSETINDYTTYYKYNEYDSSINCRYDEILTPFRVEENTNVMKYILKRIVYDKAGRVWKTIVENDSDGIEYTSTWPTFDTTKSVSITEKGYYGNGNLKYVEECVFDEIGNKDIGRRLEYKYDKDGYLSSEVVVDGKKAEIENYTFKDNEKIETRYINNYLGLPRYKITIVDELDMYGNNTAVAGTKVELRTKYEYDLNGNLFIQTDGLLYDSTLNKVVETKSKVVTQYGYDDMNRPTTVTYTWKDGSKEVSASTQTHYNWEGKPLAVTDGRGNKTEYQYNQRGFLEKLIRKNVTKQTYDLLTKSTIVEKVDEITAYKYDLAGRKTAEVLPESYIGTDINEMDQITYSYDDMGRLLSQSYKGKEYIINSDGSDLNEINVNYIRKAYKYDNNGNVIKECDAWGIEEALGGVDINGKTYEQVIDLAYGTEYTYTPTHQIEKVINADIKKDNPGKYSYKYKYDTLGRKISEAKIRDCLGTLHYDEIAYDYDDFKRTMTEKIKSCADLPDAIFEDISVNTYDHLGNLVTKTTGSYNVEYEYNSFNKVRSEVYPGDTTTIDQYTVYYKYDELGRVRMKNDSMNYADVYKYDGLGREVEYRHGIKQSYDTDKEMILSEQTKTSKQYDANGNVLIYTDAKDHETSYSYDETNRLTDTTVSYNKTIGSNVIKITHTTTNMYDKNGNLTVIKESVTNDTGASSNKISSNEYDPLNRLKRRYVVKDDGSKKLLELLEYNRNDAQKKSSVAPNADYTNGVPKYRITTFDYDVMGRLSLTTDSTDTNVIDGTTCIDKVENSYDYAGNLKSKTDGRGNVTEYMYDEFNRLKYVITPANENGKVYATRYTYDVNGNLEKQEYGEVTFENLKPKLTSKGELELINCKTMSSYGYNLRNQVIKKVYGGNLEDTDSKYEEYTYYGNGLLKTKKDRNQQGTVDDKFNYAYDCNGQLKSQSIKNGTETKEIIAYTYDANGNQLTVTDFTVSGSPVTVTRTYDELNRVISKTTSAGVVNYEYDKLIKESQIKPGVTSENYLLCEVSQVTGDNKVTKAYDNEGRLKYVQDESSLVAEYDYYDNGSLKSLNYNNTSVSEVYTYYEDDKLKTLTNTISNSNPIIYEYDYDECDNIKQKRESNEKGKTQYDYDKLNRLKSVTENNIKLNGIVIPKRITEYAYDGAGNRIAELVTTYTSSESIESKTANIYSYDKWNCIDNITYLKDLNNSTIKIGELTPDMDTSQYNKDVLKYTYDDNGNNVTITKNGVVETKYEYDNLNRLISVNDDSITYAYDGEGLRISKQIGSAVTKYLYEYQKVIYEVDGTNKKVARNIYGINLIARGVMNGLTEEKYFYMYNGHADVTALIRPDGSEAATYYYDAFGNILEKTGDVNNNITYAGYQYDEETGLYYLNARMYDPKIARFLQEDTYTGTANDPLSLNLYTYVKNNPLIYYDPTGHRETILSLDLYNSLNIDNRPQRKSFLNTFIDNNVDAKMLGKLCANIVYSMFGENDSYLGYGIPYEEYIEKEYLDELGHEYFSQPMGSNPTYTYARHIFDYKYQTNKEFAARVDADKNTNWEIEGTTYGIKKYWADIINAPIYLEQFGQSLYDDNAFSEYDLFMYPKPITVPHKEPLAIENKKRFYDKVKEAEIMMDVAVEATTFFVGEALLGARTTSVISKGASKGLVVAEEVSVGGIVMSKEVALSPDDVSRWVSKLAKNAPTKTSGSIPNVSWKPWMKKNWLQTFASKSKKVYKLSDNHGIPQAIVREYDNVKLGSGTPRLDTNGTQKIFQANELNNISGSSNNVWRGSKEWDVPGTSHRILERLDGKLGYVINHDYSKPKLFPGPWFSDGGIKQ